MPILLDLVISTILPIIIILNMLHDNKKGKKCVDISLAVVAWLTGDVYYNVIQDSTTKPELVTLILGNLLIYSFYWIINIIILGGNRAKIEK